MTTAITWISTEVNPKTRTIEARCETENPHVLDDDGHAIEPRVLRANVFGAAQIKSKENQRQWWCQRRPLQWTGKGHIVFVQTGTTAF